MCQYGLRFKQLCSHSTLPSRLNVLNIETGWLDTMGVVQTGPRQDELCFSIIWSKLLLLSLQQYKSRHLIIFQYCTNYCCTLGTTIHSTFVSGNQTGCFNMYVYDINFDCLSHLIICQYYILLCIWDSCTHEVPLFPSTTLHCVELVTKYLRFDLGNCSI